MKFIVIKRQSLLFFILILLTAATASIWFYLESKNVPAFNQTSEENVHEIHLVTSEFSTETPEGNELEAYRWDPGTIFINKGEKIQLKFLGVNGKEHPFIIEGTDYKGIVKKGKETVIDVEFDKAGTYRLVCLSHPDKEHNGPMIGYIIVQ